MCKEGMLYSDNANIIKTRLTIFFVFVSFVALRPKSIIMVMTGRSVDLTTFFLSMLETAVNQYFVHILSLLTDNIPS